MKLFVSILVLIVLVSCSSESTFKQKEMSKQKKDTPTPKSIKTLKESNEVLAPQTCYYGCKARN